MELLNGWKTIIFACVMGAIGVWRAIDPSVELPDGVQIQGALDQVGIALNLLTVVGVAVFRQMGKQEE